MKFLKNYYLSVAVCVAGAFVTPPNWACAQTAGNGEDVSSSSAFNLADLKGHEISYSTFKSLVTTGQPSDYSKQFLFYNVGTGKFLNIGGYWGTHAALSDVPRSFWLQRRNDVAVAGQNSYLRYPESGMIHNGNFADDFFTLPSLQIGTAQRGRYELTLTGEDELNAGKPAVFEGYSHEKYNYVKVINNDDNTVAKTLCGNFTPDGKSFFLWDAAVDFASQRIEAEIDMTNCQGFEYYKEATDATKSIALETILSLGESIKDWNIGITDFHMYAYKTDEGMTRLKVQCVDKFFDDNTHTHYIDLTDDESGNDKNIVKLVIKKGSVMVNDTECMPAANATAHIPTIRSVKDKEGDIVRFKVGTDGELELDDNGRYIVADDDDTTAQGIKVDNDGYLYTTETSTEMPLFVTSAFKDESSTSENEGSYLAWTPYQIDSDGFGNIGVFADRALPIADPSISVARSVDNSQWYFKPVAGADNVYQIYLRMTDEQMHKRNENPSSDKDYEVVTETGTHDYYLQAEDVYIYGNNLESYAYEAADVDMTAVEARMTLPTKIEDSYWKLITMEEYDKLFKMSTENLAGNILDITYELADPDFIRKSNMLSQWKMDSSLEGKVRIGYDELSKKSPSDTDYTKDSDDANHDIASGKYTVNHGRYMGVDVRGGHGSFYQDITVSHYGWYKMSCAGLTNAGAKLFVQRVNEGGVSMAVTKDLHRLTDGELEFFTGTNRKWPFDQFSETAAMPMYNALVAMNDNNLVRTQFVEAGQLAEYADYTTSLDFYVDEEELERSGGTMTLRLGVTVPRQETSSRAAGDYAQWTVFDNFHLFYAGQKEEPQLVLRDDKSDLNYIDNCDHLYNSGRPMHLCRTFSGDSWNTIILPVSLTHSDFTTMFGETAKLAKLDHLTSSTIEFVSETSEDDGTFLKAYMPYIIWVDADHAKGTAPAYTATLTQKPQDGVAGTETITAEDGHFYLSSANLTPKTLSDGTEGYDFANDANHVSGQLYTYKAATVAEGGDHEPLAAYGTLCMTYSGKNILEGRPALTGCYVFSNNKMNKIKTKYGTKGFRCWFGPDVDQAQAAPAATMRVSIDGVIDTPTGLDTILDTNDGEMIEGRYANGVYNLNGQKVSDGSTTNGLPAGLYIVNGHKYVVNHK